MCVGANCHSEPRRGIFGPVLVSNRSGDSSPRLGLDLASGTERAFGAAIDALRERAYLDPKRIGFDGLSFGGHWAVRLACVEPRVRAVVNVGGPVHHTFAQAWAGRLEIGTWATLAVVLGETLASLGPSGTMAQLAELSLVDAGILRPREGMAVILSINGARATQVTIDDVAVISERRVAQDTLVSADDCHSASWNKRLHLPFTVRWLAERSERRAHSRGSPG